VAYQQEGADDSSRIGQRVAGVIGADDVAYNDTPNLARAIGMPERELCFTCSTGDYTSLGIRPVFKSRIEMKGE
jgi:amidophosphoribosyltransferase